jgi:hypothetical protein
LKPDMFGLIFLDYLLMVISPKSELKVLRKFTFEIAKL